MVGKRYPGWSVREGRGAVVSAPDAAIDRTYQNPGRVAGIGGDRFDCPGRHRRDIVQGARTLRYPEGNADGLNGKWRAVSKRRKGDALASDIRLLAFAAVTPMEDDTGPRLRRTELDCAAAQPHQPKAREHTKHFEPYTRLKLPTLFGFHFILPPERVAGRMEDGGRTKDKGRDVRPTTINHQLSTKQSYYRSAELITVEPRRFEELLELLVYDAQS